MAKRFWIAGWSMGYAGTDSEEPIDLLDEFDQGQLDSMTDEEAQAHVSKLAWQMATEQIDNWARVDDGADQ